VGRVWQAESFDRALRHEEDLAGKIEYMLTNPVRAGLVKEASAYGWAWVEGQSSMDAGCTGG
jgi:hypothetical protein